MKEKNNVFKFSLHQEKLLLCERVFNADMYNPFTRYSIDIREILPKAIITFQKVLSMKKYNTIIDVGRKNVEDKTSYNHYYLYDHYLNSVENSPKRIQNNLYYTPKTHRREIEGRTIKGVECNIGLYINDKTIVERMFYVNDFNPISRWSIEMLNVFHYMVEIIMEKIKTDDVKNMWDDYDLINIKRFSINQIREFSTYKRKEMLKSIQQ